MYQVVRITLLPINRLDLTTPTHLDPQIAVRDAARADERDSPLEALRSRHGRLERSQGLQIAGSRRHEQVGVAVGLAVRTEVEEQPVGGRGRLDRH